MLLYHFFSFGNTQCVVQEKYTKKHLILIKIALNEIFSNGYFPVSSTNEKTEILLNMTLNTMNQTNQP